MRTPRPVLLTNPGADLYGSDRMLLETVSALRHDGERVVVALAQPGPLTAEVSRRDAEAVVVPTAVLRKSALRPAGMLRLLRDVITTLPRAVGFIRRVRPRAVIVNTITSPLWIVAARLTRTPVICHIHEGEKDRPGLAARLLAAPLLLADRLAVNSRFSLDVLTATFPSLEKKADIVYNAVPGPAEVVPPRAQLDGPVRVLFVGRLSPRKAPDAILRSVALLLERGVDVRFDLVGAVYPGYEWFETQLRTLTESLGVTDRVTFHGFQADIWPFVAGSDICIVPSVVDEGFGNTAVEAALGARPVVVSAGSGLLEATATLTACIRVTPGSAPQIADAVQTIVRRWPEFAAAAEQDAARVADQYSAKRYRGAVSSTLASVTTR